MIEKPDCVKEEHLEYLGEIRESSVTNMISARPYLMGEFDLDKKVAGKILFYWMKSFGERHGK